MNDGMSSHSIEKSPKPKDFSSSKQTPEILLVSQESQFLTSNQRSALQSPQPKEEILAHHPLVPIAYCSTQGVKLWQDKEYRMSESEPDLVASFQLLAMEIPLRDVSKKAIPSSA